MKKYYENFIQILIMGASVTFEYISTYEEIYRSQFLINVNNINKGLLSSTMDIIPNSMQKEALSNLKNLRIEGKIRH
ncbi:MAG: hypothetical protein R2771_06080 [Saprospiraceae bacterium]